MDYVASVPPQSQDHPLLLRRNSFPPDDVELLSIKPSSRSYTSLKDLLPSVAYVNSPNPAQTGSEIGIRNRLVKHAAWAYLQPMSTSSTSAAGNFLHRLWTRVAAFIDLIRRNVIICFL